MAGYFRRIAEQALQPTLLVHSAAALPYSPVPEPLPDEPEILSTLTSGRFERDEEPAVRSLGGQPASRLGSPAVHAPSPRSVGMTASGDVPSAQDASRFSPQPEQGLFLPTYAAPLQAALAAESHLARLHAAQTTGLRTTIVTAAAAKPESPSGKMAAKPSSRESALRPEKTPSRQTSTALTQAPRPHSRSEIATRRPSADAEPAPEVHIHIGRIELTAVSPSTAPRRESAPTKKPMSLDEYLQRRRLKDGARMP